MGRLEGKVAIITGAGTEIGRGIARTFAAEDASLFLASRKRQNLEETADEVRGKCAAASVVPTNVADEAQVAALFDAAMNEHGKVDSSSTTPGRLTADSSTSCRGRPGSMS